jgi:head-tail adaptor
MVRAGRYSKHVTVWKAPDTTPDSDGFFEALSPKDWWCEIAPHEPYESDGERMQAHRVTGRYHPQITLDTRILYGTRELFVKGVQNLGDANKEIILYCEEVVP